MIEDKDNLKKKKLREAAEQKSSLEKSFSADASKHPNGVCSGSGRQNNGLKAHGGLLEFL